MMLANYLTAIILIVLGLFCVITKKDLIKIVGRQYVGIGLVADKAFVKVAKAAES